VVVIPLSLSYGRFKRTLFRMAKQLRGSFEKFVDWRQCAAVMQREAWQWHIAVSSRTSQTALVVRIVTLHNLVFLAY
jgi:hypothetical protein